MKPITTFAQLLFRFKVRDHTQRTGRKPTRAEYSRLYYASHLEQRRADRRASNWRKFAREI